MKKLLLIAAICLFASTAWAAPFLVCDPNPGAEMIILEINGVEMPEFAAEPDGSLRYDLAGLVAGDFTVRAKAGNMWGWSIYSLPLDFTKPSLQAPMGLRVSSE